MYTNINQVEMKITVLMSMNCQFLKCIDNVLDPIQIITEIVRINDFYRLNLNYFMD